MYVRKTILCGRTRKRSGIFSTICRSARKASVATARVPSKRCLSDLVLCGILDGTDTGIAGFASCSYRSLQTVGCAGAGQRTLISQPRRRIVISSGVGRVSVSATHRSWWSKVSGGGVTLIGHTNGKSFQTATTSDGGCNPRNPRITYVNPRTLCLINVSYSMMPSPYIPTPPEWTSRGLPSQKPLRLSSPCVEVSRTPPRPEQPPEFLAQRFVPALEALPRTAVRLHRNFPGQSERARG